MSVYILLLLAALPAGTLAQETLIWPTDLDIPTLPPTDDSVDVTGFLTDVLVGSDPTLQPFFTDNEDGTVSRPGEVTSPAITTQVPVVTEFATGANTLAWDDEKKPRIIVHPRNVTIAPGGIANFRCEASGYINPMMVIVKEDSDFEIPPFNKEERAQDEQPRIEQDLLVGPVTKQTDEGWYVCIAANYYGNVRSKAYLKVLDLCADVTCKPPKVCVQDYNTATAECACPRMICDEDNFEPVCGSDCKVHFNPCVFNQTSCKNDYDSSTIIAKGSCPQTTEPEVELAVAGEIVVDEEQQVILRAKVAGYPLPTVEWMKVNNDGEIIESIGKGVDLLIASATPAMSGRYVARATNCETDHQFSRSLVLEVTPKPLPEPEPMPDRVVNVCSIFGDPHIMTFDSHSYNFAGECTYLLSMDCSNFFWFIYGDFTPCGSGTCLEQVTIFINYQPVILMRGWIINVNGEKREFIQGETVVVSGLTFTFDGMLLTGRSDEFGLTVRWDGFTGLQFGVDEGADGGSMCGVCGNNDKDGENEHRQATKLEDGLIDSVEPNVYTQNWKIDRERVCVLPANVEFDPSEPCGSNYAKSLEAKEVCQNLVDNPALQRCSDVVSLKFYYESCLFDYCYLGLLRPDDDPFTVNEPQIGVECTVARAYASHCELRGVDMRGWDSYMSCPVDEAQDAILTISCPQANQPFLRFKR